MPQNEQISARFAEIYHILLNIQELGDVVMFSQDIDNNTKCVFFVQYKMKPASIKEELNEITSTVIEE